MNIEGHESKQSLYSEQYERLLFSSDCPLIVAFSGGKDSIAIVLQLLDLGIDRKRIELHHQLVDGGNSLFDWACTQQYCIDFAKYIGIPIIFSFREGGILKEAMRENESRGDVYFQIEEGGKFHIAKARASNLNTRNKFPAVSANHQVRWCSGTVKIDVQKTTIAFTPKYKKGEILVFTGERRAESIVRSKYNKFELHGSNCSTRFVLNVRSIIDFTDAEVWAIMKRYHIQPHPAYMLGWGRCSCQLCIFNSTKIWATINVITPEKVEMVSLLEKRFKHTLYHKNTINDIVNKAKPFDNINEYWVRQATVQYDAPIYVKNWKMPLGAFSKISSGAT